MSTFFAFVPSNRICSLRDCPMIEVVQVSERRPFLQTINFYQCRILRDLLICSHRIK